MFISDIGPYMFFVCDVFITFCYQGNAGLVK